MKKWLFNPFVYVAGTKALLIGCGIMLVTAFIASLGNAHFDGAMDAHFGTSTTLVNSLLQALIAWGCLVISLYILGRVAAETLFRFIDIAGTIALARWPLLPISFLGFIPLPPIDIQKLSLTGGLKLAMMPIIIGLVALPFIVWYIALLYNAFSVSTNLKGSKAVTSFIAGLIIAEILSKVILHFCF